MKLHIDIETYSSVDIASSGVRKYVESSDFEILMIAYAVDEEPVQILDYYDGKFSEEHEEALWCLMQDEKYELHAHNAVFERLCFAKWGLDLPVERWHCNAIKTAYCGLPLSLGDVSKALELGDKGKDAAGKALIRYFCCPVKPTKANGMRTRNLPHHDPEKWEQFKQYCIQDVEAERNIHNMLARYEIPEFERRNYILDQRINDRGILVDLGLATNAINFDQNFTQELTAKAKELTGLDNPNSPAQLKGWLSEAMNREVTTLAKDEIQPLIEEAGAGTVTEVLNLRKKLSKTSIKKYQAMHNCVCRDGRAHGLFQFYGANRTGRWAGRLIQLQNLPQNKMKLLGEARQMVLDGDYDLATLLYDDVSSVLSQLIRTAFIAREGHTLAVADFSAIEARVIAWLAGEQWRLDVFNTHGKIYEASASAMFNIALEDVDYELRQKGKIAELALGYEGGVGALKTMGGERMGLSESEMDAIVKKWRKANPAIVALWKDLNKCALESVAGKKRVVSKTGKIAFNCNGKILALTLPSGRRLFYQSPKLYDGKFGIALKYKGMDQTTKQWTWIDTYGGKLTENVVQAIARDILADSMLRIDEKGHEIVMHVHDEVVCEVPTCKNEDIVLKEILNIMSQEISWASGLPLGAAGFTTDFYKKD